MIDEQPPTFRYHPDPVRTGFLRRSETTCAACGQKRGLVYTGPTFSKAEIVDELCPWCIADGSAADRFEAEFTDVGTAVPSSVPTSVLVELAKRTPGFAGWQQEYWLYHCDDAAAFMGRAGFLDLVDRPAALEMVLHENDQFGWTVDQSEAYARTLDRDGEATAYLFQCLHCGQDLAYTDMA